MTVAFKQRQKRTNDLAHSDSENDDDEDDKFIHGLTCRQPAVRGNRMNRCKRSIVATFRLTTF